MHGYEHHCWCSPACQQWVEEHLAQELQTLRSQLGSDPGAVVLAYLLQHQTRLIPKRLHRLLTGEELREVNRRYWQVGRERILAALSTRILSLPGGSEALSTWTKPKVACEDPRWQRGEQECHEYWRGPERLGFLIPADMSWAEETPWWASDAYHVVLDRPQRLMVGTFHPLGEARKRLELEWKQREAAEPIRRKLHLRSGGIVCEQ